MHSFFLSIYSPPFFACRIPRWITTYYKTIKQSHLILNYSNLLRKSCVQKKQTLHVFTLRKHSGCFSFTAKIRRISSKPDCTHTKLFPFPSAAGLESTGFSHSRIASKISKRTSQKSECSRCATHVRGSAIFFSANKPLFVNPGSAVTESTDIKSLVMLWRYCISPGAARE